jgi:hypothetical protein
MFYSFLEPLLQYDPCAPFGSGTHVHAVLTGSQWAFNRPAQGTPRKDLTSFGKVCSRFAMAIQPYWYWIALPGMIYKQDAGTFRDFFLS